LGNYSFNGKYGLHQLFGRISEGDFTVIGIESVDKVYNNAVIDEIKHHQNTINVQRFEFLHGLSIAKDNVERSPKDKLYDANVKNPFYYRRRLFPDHLIDLVIGQLGKVGLLLLPVFF
jgi:hypothetical protein